MNKFMMFNTIAQRAFDNDEAQFMNFSKLLVDTARGTVQNYSKE